MLLFLGEVLQELKDLEEMLITQVFPVVSVHTLSGEQHAYHGNNINFPQDVQEFTTRFHMIHHHWIYVLFDDILKVGPISRIFMFKGQK